MSEFPVPNETEITRLAGHRFPGGHYTVAHWENFLLTECTGADLLPDGIVHPVALFHIPIIGAGTSIAEMFELGQAESDLSIIIESYARAGPLCIRRLIMRFPQVVLDGERVVARGEVTALREVEGEKLADCDVRLEHAERGILLEGSATICLTG